MNRTAAIEQIKKTAAWDLIIIGGGATGLGAAVDAANRGLNVLVLEKNDFGKGTSGRSTKLFHGGVRYLAQGNIRLVKTALKERDILLRIAPHLSQTLNFIIPAIRWYDRFLYGAGLTIYDWLAGKKGIGKTRLISKKNMEVLLPSVQTEKTSGGILYHDGQFDDTRYLVSLALTAVSQKACVLNYAEVTGFGYENNLLRSVVFTDRLTTENYTVKTKLVINATGVFADSILKINDPQTKPMLAPSQGVHLVIGKKFFPGSQALMIPKTKDGRVLFAVPWHNKVIIGTTDTEVKSVVDEPVAQDAEIAYILEHFNLYSRMPVSKTDILSVFAGLRPLIRKQNIRETATLTRDHSILVSASQLITITGGKWTTYRKMAADVIDKSFSILQIPFVSCKTDSLQLVDFTKEKNTEGYLNCYGCLASGMDLLIRDNPDLAGKIHPEHPYTKAQVVWAIQNEMAQTVDDVLARRIRLLFLDAKAALEAAPETALLMAVYLKKDTDWIAKQIQDFNLIAKNYMVSE